MEAPYTFLLSRYLVSAEMDSDEMKVSSRAIDFPVIVVLHGKLGPFGGIALADSLFKVIIESAPLCSAARKCI